MFSEYPIQLKVFYCSGTTAVVAMLRGIDLYVANAGDSRCVLCRKDGVAYNMSDDHKVIRYLIIVCYTSVVLAGIEEYVINIQQFIVV